jgi:hypothetical protein
MQALSWMSWSPGHMSAFAFVAPIAPGKEQLDADMFERFTVGDEREAHGAARRAAGVTREPVWHQRTPDGGALAIVLLEADDVEAAFGHTLTASIASLRWSEGFPPFGEVVVFARASCAPGHRGCWRGPARPEREHRRALAQPSG